MQSSALDPAQEMEQRLQGCSSKEQLEEMARALHAELQAERQMHEQARSALTELHLANASLQEQMQHKIQTTAAADAAQRKKRRFLKTYMDPVVVLEHHLLQEKSRALDVVVAGLKEEVLALKCQKDSNSQTTYDTVERLQRALEENTDLAKQVHEARATQMEHNKAIQDLQIQLAEAQSWAAQLEREREALAAKCYTLEQELNHYKRRS